MRRSEALNTFSAVISYLKQPWSSFNSGKFDDSEVITSPSSGRNIYV